MGFNLKGIRMASAILLAVAAALVQAEPIARVEVVDGAVTASRASGKRVALAVGSGLEEGDLVVTEKDSYVRLRFTDGGEMAIRPQSTLAIQRYRFELAKPAQDALQINVVKGGMRTVTGLIGKRGNEGAYRVQGTTATIDIRGTEYVVRECSEGCSASKPGGAPGVLGFAGAQSHQKPSAAPLVVAGRLAAVAGQIVIRDGNKTRQGSVGDPLYSGDLVMVGAQGHAALVLNDQSRIVLGGGSEYRLTSVRFNPELPAKGNVASDLIKGGLRMMTGTLGKKKPESVKTSTVVAAIGIRGTNFDIWCVASDHHRPGESIRLPSVAQPCDQALYAATREGAIEVISGEYRLMVPAGGVAYVDGPGAKPELVDGSAWPDPGIPTPESLMFDYATLFGIDGTYKSDPGMYVSVKDGVVSLVQANGEDLLLRKGDTGFAGIDGRELLRLQTEPEFMKNDPYLREMNVDPSTCRAQ